MNAETLWSRARNRYGDMRDRREPSPGIACVLVALLDGPAHGGEVARRASQDQGNTVRWLRKLQVMRLVDLEHEVEANFVKSGKRSDGGRQSGGRPALVWELTWQGEELARALRAERALSAA